MPLTNSFLLATDALLTMEFSGYFDVEHKSDFSDNPQTFILYLGSLSAGHSLKATSNPGVDNITLVPTDALPHWAAATAYTLGQYRQPSSSNSYRYKVTTAGTSHASVEPTWPTSPVGATVTDGTVVWTLVGKKHVITEYKLALSSGGLTSAIAGAALNLGTVINSGVLNVVPIYIKLTNTVSTPGNDTVNPDVTLNFPGIKEF